VLATVLFTDIVASAELGDRRWRDVPFSHHSIVRRELDRFRGHEVKTVGDGFLATFDGPARAVRCAYAIRDGCGEVLASSTVKDLVVGSGIGFEDRFRQRLRIMVWRRRHGVVTPRLDMPLVSARVADYRRRLSGARPVHACVPSTRPALQHGLSRPRSSERR
jgi:hypothetical protein